MFRKCLIALGALLASGWTACAAPLEAYGKLPNIEQAAVSPSGRMVAYVLTDGEDRKVAVETVPERKPVYVGDVGTAKIRSLRWAGDGHILITSASARLSVEFSGQKGEWTMPYNIDLATGLAKPLLADVHGTNRPLDMSYGALDVRKVGGKTIVFVRGVQMFQNQGQDALFQVDPESNVATLVETGGVHLGYDWVVGPDGVVNVRSTYDGKDGVWKLMFATPNHGWRTMEQLDAPLDPPELAGVGRDRRSVLIATDDSEVGTRWREVALESGASSDVAAALGEQEPINDPKDGRLIGVYSMLGDDPAYRFFDAHDAAVWSGVVKAFPGDLVTLVSWSDDRRKLLVRVDSAELGPAFALVDLNTGSADWLGNEYAGLRAQDIAPKKAIRYKAADGFEVSGYLTLPRGQKAQNLPLVVLPHGGPEARDEPGFDWWAQALASRGYAVLQPNFRGSTLSYDYRSAGYGQWGRKMQTDLSDGVADLARRGVVDPRRVCIVGGSYGGYAALAGVTLQHGVYRCAVSVAGVSNLRELAAARGYYGRRYLSRFIGAKDEDDPILNQLSPIQHAAQADAPILLIHGRDDAVVLLRQSEEMAAALRRAGKPVEFVELRSEDHHLSRGETRLQMLEATVAFLEKNNPPD